MNGNVAVTDPAAEPAIADILASVGCPTGTTYRDLLAHMRAVPADSVAVEFGDEIISYWELLRRVAGAATHLEALEVSFGDNVAYRLRPHPNALVTYLAITLIGARAIPIYIETAGAVLRETLARMDARGIIVEPEALDEIHHLGANLRFVTARAGTDYGEAICAGADISPFLGRTFPTAQDPAVILSTSGTTGRPKGVVMANTYSAAGLLTARKWGIGESLKCYIPTSFGHGAAFQVSSAAFWSDGSVVIAPRFSAREFWNDVHRHGCNYTHLLGTMPRMLLAAARSTHERDHGLRYLVSSCGLPPQVWRSFEDRFNVRIHEIYSATDAGGCFMTNPGIFPAGSVGRPWAEVEARIVDDDGADVASGEVGALVMRPRGGSANVHYLADPEEAKTKVRDGWVWMGDAFTQDEAGNYYFVDRLRDVIRRRGVNLAPASIEVALMTHPGIDAVSAFAVPSELGEDEIKVAVVGARLTPQQIADHATTALPPHMRPRFIELVDALPTTSGTERVQRFRLLEHWRNPGTWDVGSCSYLEQTDATI
jgi:crotonobetaine/carnitine-CoA ligase